MKKLIFHFGVPSSTIILADTNSKLFTVNDIDNTVLFLEPSKFHIRLMQIVNRNNQYDNKFDEIFFVFNGELDKENSVIISNKTLDQISFKESYINYDLKKSFAPYIASTEKIFLVSHLDFYLFLKKEINKTDYPSLLIYDGVSVDIELVDNEIIRSNLNADIKGIPNKNDLTASEVLSYKYLLKSVNNSNKDIAEEFSNSMIEVIKYFIQISEDKSNPIKFVFIYSDKTELIKESLLADKLKLKINILGTRKTIYDSKGILLKYEKTSKPSHMNLIDNTLPFLGGALGVGFYVFKGVKKIITNEYANSKFLENKNTIKHIQYFSSDDSLIKEFDDYNIFEKYLESIADRANNKNYFKFYDHNQNHKLFTLAELDRISVLADLKLKIESSFYPFIIQPKIKK